MSRKSGTHTRACIHLRGRGWFTLKRFWFLGKVQLYCAPVFSPFENRPDEEKAAQTFIAMLLSEKTLKGYLE